MPYKDKNGKKNWYLKNREEVLLKAKQYYKENKESIKKYNKNRYEDKKEDILKKCKDYRESHVEECRKRGLEWQKNNPEKRRLICKRYTERKLAEDPEWANKRAMEYYNKDKEKSRKRLREYRRSRPVWTRLQKYTRRSRCGSGQVDKEHLNKKLEGLVMEKLKNQDYKCFYCGVDIKESFSIDHIIPLSKGGSNNIENIDLVCKPCNTKKSTRSKERMLEVMGAI